MLGEVLFSESVTHPAPAGHCAESLNVFSVLYTSDLQWPTEVCCECTDREEMGCGWPGCGAGLESIRSAGESRRFLRLHARSCSAVLR